MFGYLVPQKKDSVTTCSPSMLSSEDQSFPEKNIIPLMDWGNVKMLLAQKVRPENFEKVLR